MKRKLLARIVAGSIVVVSIVMAGYLFVSSPFVRDEDLATAQSLQPYDWTKEISETAGRHAQVAGVLAGFSITLSVLLLAQYGKDKRSEPSMSPDDPISPPPALGLFVIAFFGLITASVLFSIVGSGGSHMEKFLFSEASMLYYSSVIMSLCGLVWLLFRARAEKLGRVVLPALLAGVLAGYFLIADTVAHLQYVSLRWCFGILLAVIGILGALLMWPLLSAKNTSASIRSQWVALWAGSLFLSFTVLASAIVPIFPETPIGILRIFIAASVVLAVLVVVPLAMAAWAQAIEQRRASRS